jgi:hypothetical protein
VSEFLGELGGLTAGVGAEGLAFAAGFAASYALQPAAVTIRQDAWNGAPVLRLDPIIAADAAAQDITALSTMQDEASYSGYDATRFQYLYESVLTAPGMGELLNMLRRGTINTGNFEHGLAKARLEPMWTTPLEDLANVYIGIGDIAYGIVRGIFPAPSYVPVPPPTGGTSVPRFPQVNIDPEALAAKLGYSAEMLQAMVGRSGLSMAPGLAAQALFRGLINEDDFLLAIAEGDLRTEWATSVRDATRQILTASEYAELQLRGFSTEAERRTNTAKHGMSQDDSDLLYNVLGRAISVHQITTGEARGGTYNGDTSGIPEAYLTALERGNIRPEYYSLAYANRYTIPSYFVLRALLQAGAITVAQGQQYFEDLGWPPDLAEAAAAIYGTTTTAAADPNVKKAQTQLWTATHRAYVADEITDAEATSALTSAGVASGSTGQILNLWQAERGLIRKQLTPAQIKKAVSEGVTNPATGAAWTTADGLAALIARGYSANDANTFLEL